MPFRKKKKKLGSIIWTYDATSKAKLKQVYTTLEKSVDWPLLNAEEIIYRVSEIGHEDFYFSLVKTIAKIKSQTLRFKLIWALKRYSEDESKLYVLYIHSKEVSDRDISLFHEKKLVLAFFAGYYIIARNSISLCNFFCKSIEFFERFDYLVLSDKMMPFLMYGVKRKDGITLLFYCDVFGQGMLIKSKSTESKISPELEIEILKLASILKVDVPKKAAVIQLDPEDEIITEFSSINNNILVQQLIPSAFPLYAATESDIENVITFNCENLGRMLCLDVLAGSWDRHSGNYVLFPRSNNPLSTEFSLAEIDFGLFDPSWYPPSDFNKNFEQEFDEENPPRISNREGWALTRHPIVTDMLKSCNKNKVISGILSAFHNLKKFFSSEENLEEIFSDTLLTRIKEFFEPNSLVRNLLHHELQNLELEIDLSEFNSQG